ncbi:MAG: acyl-CoA synthetase [Betaproteobacteria bacterium]|nr:acyl-CoA synthetase [Betaproteobacteria bacterium]
MEIEVPLAASPETRGSVQSIPASYLPPLEHRPELVFALPELQYPLRLNAAVEFIDRPLAQGWDDRVVYLSGERSITYRDLANDVNRLGNALRKLGIRAGDRVLLRIPDRPEHVVCILALLKIGAVAVPTFTLLRAADIVYREADSEALALIADSRFLDEVENARPSFSFVRHCIAIGDTDRAGYLSYDALLAAECDHLDPARTRRDDVALLLYTSGSTGEPKGCCESHSDLLAIADGFCNYQMPLRPGDVIAGQPPIAFSMGVGFFLSYPLRFGVPAVLMEEKKPEAMLRAIERHRVTILGAVPTYYNMLALAAEDVRADVSSLRDLRSAGEALSPAVAARVLNRLGSPIRNSMGSTESLHIMSSTRSGEPIREGACGRPIPGFQIVVRDPETFEEMPRGQPGLLTFRGPTGTKYWRKPEVQARSVRNGWSILQDSVWMDNDGYLFYVGRQDDMIVTAGYNVAPTEVEAILARHPAVLESACIPAPDPDGEREQVVKACIVLREPAVASAGLGREIQVFFKQNGAPHMYPRIIEFMPSLPKTPTGKIRRSALRREGSF